MSRKNVNPWSHYKIEVPKKEVEKATSPDIENSEIVQLQNSNIADIQKFEMPEVQTYKILENQNSTLSKVQTSTTLEVQTSETPDVQKSEILQLQNSESLQGTTKSTQKVKKKKMSYRDMGWSQLTAYLSPKARKKLDDKGYKEKRDLSLILDELILNHL